MTNSWITPREAEVIADNAFGKGAGLTRLEHRVWEGLIRTKAKLIRIRDDAGGSTKFTGIHGVGNAFLAFRWVVRARGGPEYELTNVTHEDWRAGDFNVQMSDFSISVFGLRFRKEDVCSSFDLPVETPTSPTRKRGRPKGTGTMAAVDERCFPIMQRLLAARAAKSILDAAGKVAGEVDGQAYETVRERLRKRYPSWAKNQGK